MDSARNTGVEHQRELLGSTFDGLVVRCFGRFEVGCGEHIIHNWRRDKAKTLLKLLIAHGGSMQRDMLLDLLWPELQPAPAVRNLRVTLHALRRALECVSTSTPCVLTRGEGVELNEQIPIWIDVHAFRALYELAESLMRRGQLDDAITLYQQIEHLYRDDYLLDDLYDEWTVVPRERLKDQYLLVATRLADTALERRDYDACVEYCHKILARDAFREDAYTRLMRCHAFMGRPARALRWFELCRVMLQHELNIEPGDETRQLAEVIRRGGSIPAVAPVRAERGRRYAGDVSNGHVLTV
jgi:DNA-binding SARP family transcriptional activator